MKIKIYYVVVEYFNYSKMPKTSSINVFCRLHYSGQIKAQTAKGALILTVTMRFDFLHRKQLLPSNTKTLTITYLLIKFAYTNFRIEERGNILKVITTIPSLYNCIDTYVQ